MINKFEVLLLMALLARRPGDRVRLALGTGAGLVVWLLVTDSPWWIGLLLAAVLAAEGITVIMSEPGAARRDMALSAGVAHHAIDPLAEDPVARVLELTDGAGADVAFECSSINAVLDQLFDAVKPAGVIVNVSIWSSPAKVDMQKLVLKEIDLRGTIGYVNDHPATIALVQEGKIDLEPFITARIALDRLVEDGFDTLIHRKETAVKIIVKPRGE
mgnify:CR=1 FL=1